MKNYFKKVAFINAANVAETISTVSRVVFVVLKAVLKFF